METFQRSEWEQAERTIAGLLEDISPLVLRSRALPVSYNINLVVYRGLVAKAVVASALAKAERIPALASYVSVLNSKIPDLGRLVIRRSIREYKQWRLTTRPSDERRRAIFLIAHLCNQGVCGELLPLEILLDLLLGEKQPVECFQAASDLVKQAGAHLSSRPALKAALDSVFERFREVLHERRDIPQGLATQLEDLQKLRQKKFRAYPAIDPDLDLLLESAQITHEISLDDELQESTWFDTFRVLDRIEELDQAWQEIRAEHLEGTFLPEDAEEDSSANQHAEDEQPLPVAPVQKEEVTREAVVSTAGKVIGGTAGADPVVDKTSQDLVAVRKRIYLIFNHGLTFEQAAHDLLNQRRKELRGHDQEITAMIVEACAQAKAYTDFYGHLGTRMCRAVPEIPALFEAEFARQYEGVHRLETNKLRNIATLYAQLLYGNCVSWETIFANVVLDESTTTSASRIFLKILFQRLDHLMGLDRLKERLNPSSAFKGLFPTKPRKRTAFAINFFTSIELGGLTLEMRDWFKNGVAVDDSPSEASGSSFSSSSSSSSSSEESSSESSEDKEERRKRRKRSSKSHRSKKSGKDKKKKKSKRAA